MPPAGYKNGCTIKMQPFLGIIFKRLDSGTSIDDILQHSLLQFLRINLC